MNLSLHKNIGRKELSCTCLIFIRSLKDSKVNQQYPYIGNAETENPIKDLEGSWTDGFTRYKK